MDKLIATLTEKHAIAPALAEKAVGMVLGYVQRTGADGPVAAMIRDIPGAPELVARFGGAETEAVGSGGGGFLGKAMGMVAGMTGGDRSGGIMAIGQALMAEGLSFAQIRGIAQETVRFARAEAGDEAVDKVLGAVPGLKSIL